MGTPIQPSPAAGYGSDCPACTPSPFPAGQTPASLQAVIHGVTPCPGNPNPPNDLAITIYQHPVLPCTYARTFLFEGTSWTYTIDLSTADIRLFLPLIIPKSAFYATGPPCSSGPFANTLSCPGNAGQAGTADILGIVAPDVTELALTMNFQPGIRALYDDFQAADPAQRCIRLTGRLSPGSCIFLYQP